LLEPQRFIRLAEESDLIGEIGCWIAENACAELARWQRLGYPMVPISVNVSARQLRSSRFREDLMDSMRRHGVPASLLGIELTETTMVGDDLNILRELQLLDELGLTLMIDDFGTGYSSLSRLQRLKVDVLKIDKSFVRNLSSGIEGSVICQAMIQIGRTLGLQVIAEGVETQEQLAQLRLMGCDEIQGYLLSYPVPVEEAVALLLQGESIFPKTQTIEVTST
jgi:EAL domain-containing protein (putative c-di-GMP-specific phosphodiesterase class I)